MKRKNLNKINPRKLHVYKTVRERARYRSSLSNEANSLPMTDPTKNVHKELSNYSEPDTEQSNLIDKKLQSKRKRSLSARVKSQIDKINFGQTILFIIISVGGFIAIQTYSLNREVGERIGIVENTLNNLKETSDNHSSMILELQDIKNSYAKLEDLSNIKERLIRLEVLIEN